MHEVEEWHGTGRHLPDSMRLAESEKNRQVRHDPEREERYEADPVLTGVSVRVHRDGEAWNEPQMPASEPEPS